MFIQFANLLLKLQVDYSPFKLVFLKYMEIFPPSSVGPMNTSGI